MGKLKFTILVLVTLFVAVLVVLIYRINSQPSSLKVIFFNVGQGDSALVVTPEKKTILIDGGPDNTVVYKLGKYLPLWQRQIDLMILTHPHSDHVTGLVEVLKRYQVKKVLMTGVIHSTYEYEAWLNLIKVKGIPVEIAPGPKPLDFNSEVELEILHPLQDLSGQRVDNLNNSSIVLKLIYGQTSFLFTGDLEADYQNKILDQDVKAEILKVPHQGASDSLSPEFLARVKPVRAIIPVGENVYGHPSRRTIKALERVNADIYITQKDGDIYFICGQICKVKTQRSQLGAGPP